MDTSVQCSVITSSRCYISGAKSDYLGQLIVTPEMAAMKIKAMKDNKSPRNAPNY